MVDLHRPLTPHQDLAASLSHVDDRVITNDYTPTPGGLPGNDDGGALSSWYVWAAIGMYPETPGVGTLAGANPAFRQVAEQRRENRRRSLQNGDSFLEFEVHLSLPDAHCRIIR